MQRNKCQRTSNGGLVRLGRKPHLCAGWRNILPQPGEEIFEGEVVGLVKPGNETVHRFGVDGDVRAVDGKKGVGRGESRALVAVDERMVFGKPHARSQSWSTKLNTLALFLVPLLPLSRLRENLSVRTEKFQANARKLATYCLKSSSTNAISPTALPARWSDNPSIGAPDRHQRGYR